MNEFKIVLNQNFGTYVTIPEAIRKVWLEVSDSLQISEYATNLPNSYEIKIHELLEKSEVWFHKAEEKVFKEFGEKIPLELLGINLLSEDDAPDFIFGLEFGSPRESEHGIGLKMSLNTMDIIDYGDAEVAYY
jgi:hypothetical protein